MFRSSLAPKADISFRGWATFTSPSLLRPAVASLRSGLRATADKPDRVFSANSKALKPKIRK
jgi:hypothetical protein